MVYNVSMFQKRLKELRIEKKITQDELGAVLSFTRATISGYEIGRNEPSIEDLNKLAVYFDVSVDYLTGKSDVRNQEELIEQACFNKLKTKYGATESEIKLALDFIKKAKQNIE